jgi:PKD repeat protein
LTVTDNMGETDSASAALAVRANAPPVANFIFSPSDPRIRTPVHFNASSSTDSDGRIVSYSWDFGDGNKGSGVEATHGYAAAGSFQVALTVKDNEGATGSANRTVTVKANAAPVANFVFSPSDPKIQDSVYFNASSSTDSDGRIASYSWDFGDGGKGSGVEATHYYAAAGTYQVALTVVDNEGATASLSRGVTVKANASPVAFFVFSPTKPKVATTVYFNASSSTDSDGSIVSYEWIFGDGGKGAGAQVEHAFLATGTFQVTLIVRDDKGAQGTQSQTVTVDE